MTIEKTLGTLAGTMFAAGLAVGFIGDREWTAKRDSHPDVVAYTTQKAQMEKTLVAYEKDPITWPMHEQNLEALATMSGPYMSALESAKPSYGDHILPGIAFASVGVITGGSLILFNLLDNYRRRRRDSELR